MVTVTQSTMRPSCGYQEALAVPHMAHPNFQAALERLSPALCQRLEEVALFFC